jgi:Fe-S oxidoreductase
MPYFTYGELGKMMKIANFNIRSMLSVVRDGCEIVATEPTAAYCFKKIYPTLLKNRESEFVGQHTHELLDYVATRTKVKDRLSPVFAATAGYHASCHQRAMTSETATTDLNS